jgi:hypothetical protein
MTDKQILLTRRSPAYWRVTFNHPPHGYVNRSSAQKRINKLLERGFHKSGDVEDRLRYHVGQIGQLIEQT